MFDGLNMVSRSALLHNAQERGYHAQSNALLGGFDPVGLLAGLSFIAFLLHALLSFLFRPQQHAASLYLPHAAASRQNEAKSSESLLDSALEFYESMNADKNRH